MKKIILLLFYLLIAAMQLVKAQEVTITGKITDQATGKPLPGVIVLVKGTTVGAATQADGTYKLTVPPGGTTLVFSFKGYTTQEIVFKDRTIVDVILQEIEVKVWLLPLS